MKLKDLIFTIVIAIGIGIGIVLLFRKYSGFSEHLKIELPDNYDKNELEESIGNYIVEYMNEKKDELKGEKGLPGKQGKQGPRGFSSGTFLNKGYIRSLANPTLVLNRLYGGGSRAISFLDKEQMKPEQSWTWETDKTIRNGYYNDGDSQCLTGVDDASGEVSLQSCKPEEKTQHWLIEDGRIKWLGNMKADGQNKNQKCLTLQKRPSNRGITIEEHNKNGALADLKNLEVAMLDDCNRCDKADANCSVEKQLSQKWHI